MRNLVAQDSLVHGHKDKTLQLCLRHQQPVERVAMQLRKRPGQLRLLDRNRQRQEIVSRDRLFNGLRKVELARSSLDGNLPNRRRADKDRKSSAQAKSV